MMARGRKAEHRTEGREDGTMEENGQLMVPWPEKEGNGENE